MARDLHPAPLLHQHAIGVDQKGAALNASHLLAIHILLLDDAEQIAHGFVGVGDEGERKFVLGLEVLMRLQRVARDTDDHGAGRQEFGVQVAEVLAFGGAARRVVLGVEIQDHGAALALVKADRTNGAFRGEWRGGLADAGRHFCDSPLGGIRATTTRRPSAIRML
ncbi:hypothetical protein D3C72_1349760 [compost metagenome]